MTNSKRLWVVATAVAMLSVGACATSQQSETSGRKAQEAAVRYVLSENASALQSSAAAYCLGVGNGAQVADAPASLIADLSDITPSVRQASACATTGPGVTERQTGRPALLFSVQALGCHSQASCRFTVGYYEGNMSAQSSQVLVRKTPSGWIVDPRGSVLSPIS